MSDQTLRLSIFLAVLLLMTALEFFIPRRHQRLSRQIRWPRNFGIILIDTIIVRLMSPLTAGAIALSAAKHQIGILNVFILPPLVTIPIVIITFDFLIYWQHVIFHRVPILWRMHMVHHIDQELDVTSGIRFHPLEIVLSTLIKSAAVLLLGAPFSAVVTFEILLNACAMFNHANVKIPFDRFIRKLIVTPDMHRIHHSARPQETHSNYGFNLSFWDHIFGTYTEKPINGHEEMTLGLPNFQDPQETGLLAMLLHPFNRK